MGGERRRRRSARARRQRGARGTHLSLHLLKQGIVQPRKDIPPPMPLLLTRRHLSNRPLINLPNPRQRLIALLLPDLFGTPISILLQPCIIEPNVVVARFVRQFLLVLDTTLAEDGGFDPGAVAELFFEVGVGGVELGGAGTGESVEGELWLVVERERRRRERSARRGERWEARRAGEG